MSSDQAKTALERLKEMKNSQTIDIISKSIGKPFRENYSKMTEAFQNLRKNVNVPEKLTLLSKIGAQAEEFIPGSFVDAFKFATKEESFNKSNAIMTFSCFQDLLIKGRRKKYLICGFKTAVQMYLVEAESMLLIFSRELPCEVKMAHFFCSNGRSILLIYTKDLSRLNVDEEQQSLESFGGLAALDINTGDVVWKMEHSSTITQLDSNDHFAVIGTRDEISGDAAIVFYKICFSPEAVSFEEEFQIDLASDPKRNPSSSNSAPFSIGSDFLVYPSRVLKSSLKDVSNLTKQPAPNEFSSDFSNEENIKALSVKAAKQINEGVNVLYSKYKEHVAQQQRPRKKSFEYYPHMSTTADGDSSFEVDSEGVGGVRVLALQLFDVAERSNLLTIPLPLVGSGSVDLIKFNHGGNLVAVAIKDHPHVLIIEVFSGALLYSLYRGTTSKPVVDINFHPSSEYVCITTERGTMHIFAISPFGGHVGVYSHRVIKDNKLLMLGVERPMFNSGEFIKLRPVGRIYNAVVIPKSESDESRRKEGEDAESLGSQSGSQPGETMAKNLFDIDLDKFGVFRNGKPFTVNAYFDGHSLLIFNSLFQRMRKHILLPRVDSSNRYFTLDIVEDHIWDMNTSLIAEALAKKIDSKQRKSRRRQNVIANFELKPCAATPSGSKIKKVEIASSADSASGEEKTQTFDLHLFDLEELTREQMKRESSKAPVKQAINETASFEKQRKLTPEEIEGSILTFDVEGDESDEVSEDEDVTQFASAEQDLAGEDEGFLLEGDLEDLDLEDDLPTQSPKSQGSGFVF